MKLSGNTILITGATSGIGLALAHRFHALGNKVLAVGRNREKLMQMEGEMDDLTAFVCDISNREALEDLVTTLKANHPDLNILINNAGVQYNYLLDSPSADPNLLEHEVDVNLHATIRLCQALLPQLRYQPRAAIVNVSSTLAFAPKRSAPIYCATKAGVHAFTQALRYQMEDTSVKVFELIPPLVDTPMTRGRDSGKMDTETLVTDFVRAFKRDEYEITLGKARALRAVIRVWPSIGHRLLKNA